MCFLIKNNYNNRYTFLNYWRNVMNEAKFEVSKKECSIKNLVFKGGGIKGLGYVGVLQALEEEGVLRNIENVGGASAGAITALVLALGYSNNETEEILKKIDFKDILEDGHGKSFFGMINLAKTYGIHPGKKFRQFISQKIIEPKLGKANATFSDLNAKVRNQKDKTADARFRDIHMIGTNLSTGSQEIFSYYTTSEMPLVDALCISMSIPIFFEPKIHQKDNRGKFVKNENGALSVVSAETGEMYVDGGVVNNYPIDLFDTDYPNPQTLGFRVDSLHSIVELRDQKKPKVTNIKGFLDYGTCLFSAVSSAQDKNQLEDNFRTVYIDIEHIGTTQFVLSTDEQKMLINNGRKATKQYFTHKKLQLPSKENLALKDKNRHQKYDRYKIYDRADKIFCQFSNTGSLCKIQMTFIPYQNQPWWELQKKVSEYYRRLCHQPQVHHLKHAKCLVPIHQQILTIMVEPAMAEELCSWMKKHEKTDRFVDICANDTELIMLNKREGTIRPKWMTIPDPQGENKKKLFNLVSVSNLAGVQELLENGVSADSFNEKGSYVLHEAAYTQLPELINLLLDHGAKIESLNAYGDTPLHTAVFNNSPEMALALLIRNANPNAANSKKETPLLLACKNKKDNPELLILLLEYGANINAQDCFGENVLHKLAFQGSVKSLEVLLEKPSALSLINIRNEKEKNTPLHIAIEKGHRDLIQLLVSKGADIHIQNKNGKSALDIAKDKGLEKCLQSKYSIELK